MKLTEVVTMLTEIKTTYNVPFTYYAFPDNDAPLLPFITYFYPSTANIPADNKVYQRVNALTIELYTNNKDFTLEENVESVFNSYGLVWDKTEDYINSEHMFMITYETEIYVNAEQN